MKSGTVSLMSQVCSYQNLLVPVRVAVEPFLVAEPSSLFLGHREPAAKFSHEIVISLSRKLDSILNEDQLRVSHNLKENLQIDTILDREARKFLLTCEFKMPASLTYLSGEITISAGEVGSIVIPVAAKIQASKNREPQNDS